MQAILRYFWRLCLLQETPARIPSSLNLTVTTISLYFVVGMLSFAVSRDNLAISTMIGVSLVSVAIEGSALYGLLWFKRVQQRLLPTATAVFACNTLFLIALLPVNYALGSLEPGTTSEVINTLSVLSLFWWLAIIGYILREAAGISMFQGIVLAFVIELLVALAIRNLFSEFSPVT